MSYRDRTVQDVVEGLTEQSYRLEVVGEAVAVEAREVRHAAAKLPDIHARLESEGAGYDDFAAAQAALDSLRRIEQDIRHLAEKIRDVTRNI